MDYKLPMFSEKIANAFSYQNEDPKVFKNLLSCEDLQFLREEQDNCEKVEKRNGIINFKYPKQGTVETFLKSKLFPYLGDFERHGGSYFLTPVPFHVHNDSGKEDEMAGQFFPYKNILIPLVSSRPDSPLHTIFFKQRSYGQASHFWRGDSFVDQEPLYNFKVTDYQDLLNFTNEPFDRVSHQQHLSHLHIECLWGLSIECFIPWEEGDVIVFDCSQLHASNNFSMVSRERKHGISFFAKKVIV